MKTDWTPAGVAIYLATLAPFVLVFIAGGLGWRIAPLEHLSPTPANLVAGAATFVVGMFVVGSRWGDRRIEPLSGPVVPELEPPDGLPPAAADVLIHGRSSRRDVTATIVDLALRGFVQINERSTTKRTKTWILERIDGPTGELREYERVALAGLFAHGPTVELATLETRFFVAADLVEEELEREVVRRGWFASPPGRLRSRWATAGWVTALAGIAVTFVLGNLFTLGLAGAAISAIGVIVYAAAPWRPARTVAGMALARRASGFELFLRTAEAERQRFAERERIFEDYLPYAIAFGFVDQWIRGFGLVDRPGDFDATSPAVVPLGAGLIGLVGQLEAAAADESVGRP